MGHLDDGRALVVQLPQHVHHLFSLSGVEVARGLVGEDQRRPPDQGAGDADALLLAAGELMREQVLLGHHLEAVEQLAHPRLAPGPLHLLVEQGHLQVFVNRLLVDQVIGLEDEADVPPVHLGALLLAQTADLPAEKPVLAGRRFVEHAHDVQQRRLAGAARPHDRQELPLLDLEVHVAQHVGPEGAGPVVLLDVAHLDHGGFPLAVTACAGSLRGWPGQLA